MTLLLVLILLPLAGALALTGLRSNDRLATLVALGVSLVELALVIPLWIGYAPAGDRLQQVSTMDWIPAFGIHVSFGMDGIALVMIAVIALLVPIVIGALRSTDRLPEGRTAASFLALVLLQESLTIAVFAATDVFLFYVLFEIMLIPMYFLIGSYGGPRRQYAAVKFFLYSFLGGLIMLASAIGAYTLAADELGQGTFDWATLVTVVSDAPLGTQIWLFLGFFLAFAIKAPLVPFHTWLPDAAGQAPIGVTVLLVGVLDKVGTFGFLRYCLPMFPDASAELASLVLVLAVAGVIYGSILAAGQRDLKRFIAYVSIAHFGFIALGIFAFTARAQVGSVSYMLNHSLATGMLILVLGMIAQRGGSTRISDYGGMAKVTPILGGMLLIAGLSTLSLPGTNSFISEFLVLLGSFETRPAFAIVATVGMVLAAVYVLWLYQRIMTGPVRGDAMLGAGSGPGTAMAPERGAKQAIRDLSVREIAVLAPLVVLIIGLGFYPKPVLDTITPSVQATMASVQEGN
ncbi:NADH-quinone oxidoreductase subunit M [Amycolatopsis arida]|uniref:NADH-quinone oxidoreductase subunit M n=1 Tax=Amycolatopsis arida TaxID=587909 RepID=A0A1I6A752_9PSEU|nr:NADH-quinone oxidoreductase subunit M [Amycolatopsis arida]TDX88571.1 NADH-quinone oxidoreductase subunit M [Amycolatopsis arida]SFQ64357.1 NADH-quinone oxidoreductase subunit M [Amycolatopsis arida]